ncbi:CLDN7 [Branchiostoma lanceolatum]|uniref:CLDN7 protein n=1 Tax=Branchiostoma lanceolatum TaxID=7740 RepID=A0A8J9ZEB9_BRALA|nr:CLDN7 [Branchiostoma lanceolatum]
MNRLLVGGVGSSLLGCVLYVVGIATTAWLSEGHEGQKIDAGLWLTCLTQSGVTICSAYPGIGDLTGAFNATRAFAVIGLLLLLLGTAVACFAAKKNSNKLKIVGGALIVAAGICGVMAAAIYTGNSQTNTAPGFSVPYGYSFYLTWVQAVFTVGGGAVIIAAGRRGED